jgi:hypothetical protein
LNKLPNLIPIAKAKAKTEFAIGAIIIREETLIVDKVPTTTKDCQRRYSKEYRLCKLASVNKSAIRDKTISDTIVFEDTISYQSSDSDLYYIDRILVEKHKDRNIYYLIL